MDYDRCWNNYRRYSNYRNNNYRDQFNYYGNNDSRHISGYGNTGYNEWYRSPDQRRMETLDNHRNNNSDKKSVETDEKMSLSMRRNGDRDSFPKVSG